MIRSSALALSILALFAACRGKEAPRADPAVARQLADCEQAMKDQKAYLASLEKQLADLQLQSGGTVLVTLQGEVMKITGRGPSEQAGSARGSADDARLYEAFVESLKRSRGSIQKCYQSALKNDTALQARTLTLSIEVDYKTSGAVSGASFQPRVSDNFALCMDTVARRWSLPAMPRAVRFAYKQSLTPE